MPAVYLAGNDLLRIAAEVSVFMLGGIFATVGRCRLEISVCKHGISRVGLYDVLSLCRVTRYGGSISRMTMNPVILSL